MALYWNSRKMALQVDDDPDSIPFHGPDDWFVFHMQSDQFSDYDTFEEAMNDLAKALSERSGDAGREAASSNCKLDGYEPDDRLRLSNSLPDAFGDGPTVCQYGNDQESLFEMIVQLWLSETFDYGLEFARLFPLDEKYVAKCENELPHGSLVELVDGSRLATPEFRFLSFAASHTCAETLALGMELCSVYATDACNPISDKKATTKEPQIKKYEYSLGEYAPMDPGANPSILALEQPEPLQFWSLDRPITCVDDLRSYLHDARKLSGYSNAMKALRYVQEGAVTPMESYLYILLCLPKEMGGYGLVPPRFGGTFDASNMGMGSAPDIGGPYRAYDLIWPWKHLAMEFVGDEPISSTERRALCAERTLGIDVICVTTAQIQDPDTFDEAVRLLAKRLGETLPSPNKTFLTHRNRMRERLAFPRYEAMRLTDEDIHQHDAWEDHLAS